VKRLLTSSKWGIVLISGAAAIIAALFDKVSMDKAFEVITILGGAAIGGTAVEDAVAKAKGTMKEPKTGG